MPEEENRKNIADELRRQVDASNPGVTEEAKPESKDDGMKGMNVIVGVFGAAVALGLTALAANAKHNNNNRGGPKP